MEPCAFTWENDALSKQASQSIIHARLSLGLSIGLVPADRGIVTRGVYRFVRHPIYTGLLIALLLCLNLCCAPTRRRMSRSP
jgi:protein-S-isoprenylcysteine O-methyltransferase Ste14